MGKVYSKITRPIRNFNVESRAHNIISKEKPAPAPKHKANVVETERMLRENPQSYEELLKKDTALDKYLKDVYVTSTDPVINTEKQEQQMKESLERPLPLDRKLVEQYEFGFHEPNKIPAGRSTLRQILKFLTSHMDDPVTWNSTKIALEYKIPEDTIRNIIKYFRIYKVYIPDKKSKIVFAEPSLPKRHRLENIDLKNILKDSDNKEKK